MTPELKAACELVFQEHKLTGNTIKWDKNSFHGKIPIALTEMARQTLVKKSIIIFPGKSKKTITKLNPVVAAASSFEEAEKIAANAIPEAATLSNDPVDFALQDIPETVSPAPVYTHRLMTVKTTPSPNFSKPKWYRQPVFYYFIWPVCIAAAGALITYLIDVAYTRFFSNP
jgi:hypothetical protein